MWNDLTLIDAPAGDAPAPVHRATNFPPMSEVAWQINVLVVDDDLADTWLIVNALRSNGRVRNVVTANMPDEILFQLAQGTVDPNLILLDLKMPKVNGFKFVDALKEIPAMIRVPVVFLTTSRYERDVASARTKNVRGYIIKPDKYEDLCERLNAVIMSAASEWRR